MRFSPANPTGAPPLESRGAWWRSLLGSSLGPFLGLMLVYVLFAVLDARYSRNSTFASLESLQTILIHTSAVAVAALGMTLIIIAGGIDLSAGTSIALSATITAWCFREGVSPPVAIAAGILTGCACGAVNGLLISALRVVPFIVTLGTMTLFRGFGRILSGDIPIRAHGQTPEWLLSLQKPTPEPEWLIVSSGVWLMVALSILVSLLLRYTIFGRHVFALGSNEATARLCGIHVPATRVAVYVVAGFFVGIAGLYQFTVLGGEGDPTTGLGKELRIIAAVVVGGGSLSGGRGSVLGTLSGAAIMAVIDHGCTVLQVPDPYQDILIGVIIVTAVTLDQLRQRRLAA